MNEPRRHHPDLRSDAPGRIPESLIDAAIDGDLDPQLQQQIGDALRYDHARRQEMHDTRDAINALRMPVEMPDLSDRVLDRANRHRRFIPRKLRQQVRAGRVAMAALLLVGFLATASLQRMYPRLTTIAAQQTPVHDLHNAVEKDSAHLAQALGSEVNTLRERVAPVAGLFDRPVQPPSAGNPMRYELAVTTASFSGSLDDTAHARSAFSADPGLAVVTLLNAQARSDSRSATRRGFYADAQRLIVTPWAPDALTASRGVPQSSTLPDDLPDLP